MRCPKCGCLEDRVIDSRSSRDGAAIRRRRQCLKCDHRFTTYEEVERGGLLVVKRDGRREEFSRDKLLSGMLKSCQKRPISPQLVEESMQRILDQILKDHEREVPCVTIGEMVMLALRDIDPVAYVRFASVYRRFEEAGDFVQAVKKLEIKNDTATIRLPGF